MMTKYEEELEINDFPATARFKVLSRESLTHLAEYSDCMITVKGQYYPPGHNPPEGERKLFLAIESECLSQGWHACFKLFLKAVEICFEQ